MQQPHFSQPHHPHFPPPPKRGLGAGAIAAIVIASLFGGCVVLGAIGRAASSAGAAEPPALGAKSPALPVAAAELFDRYQANEVAADELFKGRAVLVTGTVAGVEKDFTDGIVIRLATSNQFMPVDAAVVSSQKAAAARTSRGDEVTLRCVGRGMIMGRPQLDGCAFE